MCLPRLLSQRIEAQRVSHTLDHGRFPRSPAADQDVEVPVEMNSRFSEEPAFPGHSNKLGVRLRQRITIQADARIRGQERLPQRLDRHSRHFDEAGRAVLFQVFRAIDVASVYDRDGAVAKILSTLILQNLPNGLRSTVNRPGKFWR